MPQDTIDATNKHMQEQDKAKQSIGNNFWTLLIALSGLVVAVGLIVGLSVGLTCRNESESSTSDEALDFSTIKDLLIVGGTILTVNDDMDVLTNTAVYVDKEGLIADVGEQDAMRATHEDADFVIELDDGDILFPGFINTHNHVCMTALGDVADDMELNSWLTQVIFPLEAQVVSAEFCTPAFTLGVAEMLQSGTTTFVDQYFYEEEMAKLVENIGIRAVLCESVINFPQPDFGTPNETLSFADGFLQRWQNHKLVTPCVGPHAPFTTDPWIYQQARALVDKHGGVLVTHLSESPAENATVQELYGMSPTEMITTYGFLSPKTLLAHSIWLSDSDINLIAASGASVVHLPTSNMKLASGAMRWNALNEANVNVALGTDGPASNNNLDMIDEMRTASLLQKVIELSPTVLTSEEAMITATIAGAKAIGKEAEIGSIELGKIADLAIIKRSLSYSLLPAYDPYSAIVYAANGNNVFATIVNGKILYYNRTLTTIDEETLREDVLQIQEQVETALVT